MRKFLVVSVSQGVGGVGGVSGTAGVGVGLVATPAAARAGATTTRPRRLYVGSKDVSLAFDAGDWAGDRDAGNDGRAVVVATAKCKRACAATKQCMSYPHGTRAWHCGREGSSTLHHLAGTVAAGTTDARDVCVGHRNAHQWGSRVKRKISTGTSTHTPRGGGTLARGFAVCEFSVAIHTTEGTQL